MTNREIMMCRLNLGIGDKVKCKRFIGGDGYETVYAEVIGKYPNHVLVKYKKQRWCVQYVDLVLYGN